MQQRLEEEEALLGINGEPEKPRAITDHVSVDAIVAISLRLSNHSLALVVSQQDKEMMIFERFSRNQTSLSLPCCSESRGEIASLS
ncbi:unnamed protein product [Arabis nemorensis]|uniref:Uncharacterized protein n=1 Tax=Arabis nemorensis TaxID=586526 RepID=A0A565BUC4_9BRAS|nr:unnamed protein product [Arabis nemorensis]